MIFSELQIINLCDSLLEIIVEYSLYFDNLQDFLLPPHPRLREMFVPINQIPLTIENVGNFPANIEVHYFIIGFRRKRERKKQDWQPIKSYIFFGQLDNGLFFLYKSYLTNQMDQLSLARSLTEARRWLLEPFDDSLLLWTQAYRWVFNRSNTVFWWFDEPNLITPL